MKKRIIHSLVSLMLLLGATAVTSAQIKQIQMKIDGYLCGN
jgi:hypothetical protein